MIHPPVMTQGIARCIAKIIINRWHNAGYRNIKFENGVWVPAKSYSNIWDTVGCVANSIMNGVVYEPNSDGLPLPTIYKAA